MITNPANIPRHIYREMYVFSRWHSSYFPSQNSHIFSQLNTQCFIQVQWAMICHCDRNEYFQSDITVHLVFPDVLRTLQRKWASCILLQYHSWHSHKAPTASSLMKGVTQTTRTWVRGSSHTFKPHSNPVNLTPPRSYSYPAIQKHVCTPAFSIHICLNSTETMILFTMKHQY